MDRLTLRTIFYLAFVEVLSLSMILAPAYALNNYTGYVRVLPASATTAYINTNAVAFRSAVASAALAPTVATTALRIVTGPIGWGALAVTAGLTLAQMYYSQQDLQAIKTEALAAQPSQIGIASTGYVAPQNAGYTNTLTGCSPWSASCVQAIRIPNSRNGVVCVQDGQTTLHPIPAGWQGVSEWPSGGPCRDTFFKVFSSPDGLAAAVAPTTISQPTLEGWMSGVPENWPYAPKNKAAAVGTETAPIAADNTVTYPVSSTETPTVVKKAGDVLPTDAVVNPNVPPPTGAQPQPATDPGTSTTTTTTTTNPDGSVTQTQTDQAAGFFCNVGNHDQRSMGGILTDHMNVWKNVGILGTLNNLKNIVWPSALPTYTFGPTALGTFTLNFSTWAWAFADVRSIMIATSGLYGVVIVFRGRASS
jgi:hypothetical protein